MFCWMSLTCARIASALVTDLPPSAASRRQIVELHQDIGDLGVRLDERAVAHLLAFPLPVERVLPQFLALDQEFARLFLVALDQAANRLADLRLLLGIFPQHVLEENEIVFGDCTAAEHDRMRAQHTERVFPAAIRYHDLLSREFAPKVGDRSDDARGD